MYNIFTKHDEPKIKPLLDSDNLESKYVTCYSTHKSLGFGQTSLKYYITVYELIQKDTKPVTYYKLDDVKAICEFKEKLDKMYDLLPVLELSDPKTIKRLFEKYKIRFLPSGTHPFGQCHMYYKEDLEMIKEKFSEHKEAHSNTFNYHDAAKHNGKTAVIKQLAEIDNLDNEYITYQKACITLGVKDSSLKYFVTCYEQERELVKHTYCKVEDINNLSDLKEKVDTIKNLANILNLTSKDRTKQAKNILFVKKK